MIRMRRAAPPAVRRNRAGGDIGRLATVTLLASLSIPAATLSAQASQHPECAPHDRACQVDRYLDRIRSNPQRLDEFVRDIPKGGDLHNHLHGAVSTESLIRYAAEDGRCIDADTLQSSLAPCEAGQRPARDAITDPEFRQRVLRAWSMKDFEPGGEESGHDHFFATFGKFWAAAEGRDGDMLAEVASDAARQRQFYIETLLSRQSEQIKKLVEQVGFTPTSDKDLARLRRALLREGLGDVERAAQRRTDEDFARYRDLLGCGTPEAGPACSVEIRLDYQVARARTPANVFAQLVLGFELSQSDPRFVGVNMVQPEDHPVAVRDYSLHMRMIRWLRQQYPNVDVTLHAGELVPGLVKPEELTYHIREAVDVARAERIGHGIDLRHETGWRDLLDRMADRNVAVEAPLTSNCQILRVCGPDEHPLTTYLEHDVPVVLATDDPGVSRSSITQEYRRAARDFELDYSRLKESARNSLEYAFVKGDSLWADADDFRVAPACAAQPLGAENVAQSCAELLRSSAKARLQWRQEAAFRAFEHRYAAKART